MIHSYFHFEIYFVSVYGFFPTTMAENDYFVILYINNKYMAVLLLFDCFLFTYCTEHGSDFFFFSISSIVIRLTFVDTGG